MRLRSVFARTPLLMGSLVILASACAGSVRPSAPASAAPAESPAASQVRTSPPAAPSESTGASAGARDSSWQQVMTDQSGGERMYGVTAGDGIFVAVGHAGVAYMPHGDERGTASKGSTDVAPLTGLAWVSKDGHHWDGHVVLPDFTDAGPEAVAWTGTKFVAVGHAGTDSPGAAVWTSVDGADWYRVADGNVFAAPPNGGGSNLWSVAASAQGVVAVGREWTVANDTVTSGRAAAWFSADGTTWTRSHSIADGEDARFNAVAQGPTGWIAGGVVGTGPGRAALWSSTDGDRWTRIPASADFPDGAVESIVRGGPGFVAVGVTIDAAGHGAPAAWTSTDGLAWRPVQAQALSAGAHSAAIITGIAATDSGLVAIGVTIDGSAWRGTVWTSKDGSVWATSADDPALSGGPVGPISNGPLSIAANGPTVIAVGSAPGAPAAIWARFAAP